MYLSNNRRINDDVSLTEDVALKMCLLNPSIISCLTFGMITSVTYCLRHTVSEAEGSELASPLFSLQSVSKALSVVN